jgi:hypothetical protein
MQNKFAKDTIPFDLITLAVDESNGPIDFNQLAPTMLTNLSQGSVVLFGTEKNLVREVLTSLEKAQPQFQAIQKILAFTIKDAPKNIEALVEKWSKAAQNYMTTHNSLVPPKIIYIARELELPDEILGMTINMKEPTIPPFQA